MENKYVAALILNPKNEILLQRKDMGYRRWPGFWTTFGGGINDGESPIEAFYREIIDEETNLKLYDISLFEILKVDGSKCGNHGRTEPGEELIHCFSAKFDGDISKIVLREGAGFSLWGEDELPNIKDKTFPYIYDVIQRFYQNLKS